MPFDPPCRLRSEEVPEKLSSHSTKLPTHPCLSRENRFANSFTNRSKLGYSNNRRNEISDFKSWHRRETTCVTLIESPPSSKKLSSEATLSNLSTSPQILATVC